MHLGKPFTAHAFFEMLMRFLPRAESPAHKAPPHVLSEADMKGSQTAIIDAEMIPLLRDFIDRLPARVEDLKGALATGDTKKVALLAHRLKGSAGLYGFPALSALGASLEDTCQESNTPDAERLFKEICEMIHSVHGNKEKIVAEREKAVAR
jgi:HPt (histidine-containing phosphotransfer) domain-containing protein